MPLVGIGVGTTVTEGVSTGSSVGFSVGASVGSSVGSSVGFSVGFSVGSSVGGLAQSFSPAGRTSSVLRVSHCIPVLHIYSLVLWVESGECKGWTYSEQHRHRSP